MLGPLAYKHTCFTRHCFSLIACLTSGRSVECGAAGPAITTTASPRPPHTGAAKTEILLERKQPAAISVHIRNRGGHNITFPRHRHNYLSITMLKGREAATGRNFTVIDASFTSIIIYKGVFECTVTLQGHAMLRSYIFLSLL
jgi:hypothetical protein